MHGIFTYIYHKKPPNVGKYTITWILRDTYSTLPETNIAPEKNGGWETWGYVSFREGIPLGLIRGSYTKTGVIWFSQYLFPPRTSASYASCLLWRGLPSVWPHTISDSTALKRSRHQLGVGKCRVLQRRFSKLWHIERPPVNTPKAHARVSMDPQSSKLPSGSSHSKSRCVECDPLCWVRGR